MQVIILISWTVLTVIIKKALHQSWGISIVLGMVGVIPVLVILAVVTEILSAVTQ